MEILCSHGGHHRGGGGRARGGGEKGPPSSMSAALFSGVVLVRGQTHPHTSRGAVGAEARGEVSCGAEGRSIGGIMPNEPPCDAGGWRRRRDLAADQR